MRDDAPVAGGVLRLAYLRWDPPHESSLPPIILLHGSPGGAEDFEVLAPMLAAQGRTVLAVDQPGFGYSMQGVVDRSLRTAAHAVLSLMDDLKVPRAHIVGWSNGGGTAINMADLSPDRVESLTLLAAIGAQSTEGSGDFYFEHFKYAVGYAIATAARELVPHFGLLDGLDFIRGSMLNFWDTDQRPLEGVMRRLTVPTLILHGRDDFLVPAWAAERHHELIPKSRLIVIDASHFIPFLQADQAALHLSNFFQEVERGEEPDGEVFDLAPRSNPLGELGERAERFVRAGPWWLVAIGLAVLGAVSPLVAVAVAGYLVGRHQLDLALAMTGVSAGLIAEAVAMWLLGRLGGHAATKYPVVRSRVGLSGGRVSEIDWSRRLGLAAGGGREGLVRLGLVSRFQPWRRAEMALAAGVLRVASLRLTAGVVLGSVLWAVVTMIAATIITTRLAGAVGGRFEGGWAYAGTIVGAALALPLLSMLQHALTWTGRQRIKARVSRMLRYEFWPSWVFYLPLASWIVWLCIRHRGVMTFSCCNPGIEGGGGIIGESKARIMGDLAHAGALALEADLVEAGPSAQERTLEVKRLLDSRPGLRGRGAEGFPVILKPDGGQRGYAVRLARDFDDVLAYFQEMTRAAVVQKYHPGPRECGVLWARRMPTAQSSKQHISNRGEGGTDAAGFIFSITRKEFPVVTGDGKHTLEELVYSHRRLRCQARVFFTRFPDDRSRVLAAGEAMRLAEAGNHCQGTLFLDGEDLATEALADAIDRIAREFPRGGREGLDFGRFDLRYESDELLRAGRGFAIVELNGTTSESTNLYDPTKNIVWAYGVLFRQWSALYRLGEARRRAGVRPVSVGQFFRTLWVFFRRRPGSSVSD